MSRTYTLSELIFALDARDNIDVDGNVTDQVLHLGGTTRRGTEWRLDVDIDVFEGAPLRDLVRAALYEAILDGSMAGEALVQDMADAAGEAGDDDVVAVCTSLLERRNESRNDALNEALKVARWLLAE